MMDEHTNNNRNKVLFYLKLIVIVILLTASALWLVNNILDIKYKADVWGRPCEVCKEFNKPQSACINNCFYISNSSSIYNISGIYTN